MPNSHQQNNSQEQQPGRLLKYTGLALATVAAACGSDDDDDGPTPVSPEDQAAAARRSEERFSRNAETVRLYRMPSSA